MLENHTGRIIHVGGNTSKVVIKPSGTRIEYFHGGGFTKTGKRIKNSWDAYFEKRRKRKASHHSKKR